MYSHVLAYVLLLAVSLVSATPRVLMLCAGSRSRVMPMAALARELREAGGPYRPAASRQALALPCANVAALPID